MIETLITILVVTLLLGVLYWGLHKIWAALSLPVVIVWVFWLVRTLGLSARLGV